MILFFRKEKVLKRFALTTFDNPFDPFDDFKNWFSFDTEKGYNTSGLLARISSSSNDLPDEDQSRIIEESIDKLLLINPSGNLKKLERG